MHSPPRTLIRSSSSKRLLWRPILRLTHIQYYATLITFHPSPSLLPQPDHTAALQKGTPAPARSSIGEEHSCPGRDGGETSPSGEEPGTGGDVIPPSRKTPHPPVRANPPPVPATLPSVRATVPCVPATPTSVRTSSPFVRAPSPFVRAPSPSAPALGTRVPLPRTRVPTTRTNGGQARPLARTLVQAYGMLVHLG